jgi:hypothetical protein
MASFRIPLAIVLIAASLGSALAAEASAAPSEYLMLDTAPHSVGQYSVLLTLFEQVPKFTFLGVILDRGTRRVFQDHEWEFDLKRGDFSAEDDLASAQLATGELTPGPGQRPNYGSIDMGFQASGPLQSLSVPCRGSGKATFSQRSGTLGGTIDFNTNSGLGDVDVPALQATVGRFTIPSGCGSRVLDELLNLQIGLPSEPGCGEGLFLAGGGPIAGGRNAFLVGDKFRFRGRDVALADVDVTDPPDQTAPAVVDHFADAFGPPGMVAASRSLDFARVRGRPGHPFLAGFMGFHRTRPVEERHRKGCTTSDAPGRWKGRLVARFDIGGHAVLRSFTGGVLRTSKTGGGGTAAFGRSTLGATSMLRRAVLGIAGAGRLLNWAEFRAGMG